MAHAKIDLKELEELKKKLESEGINPGKVRFVALNAPFKRRSPIPWARSSSYQQDRFVNIVAELTLNTLGAHGGAAWPNYSDALITACRNAPPPFGTKEYGEIYRDVAKDPAWMATSLIQNAQGEGEGSGHLWDLAASTPDERVAAMVKAHAIDESPTRQTITSRCWISLSRASSMRSSMPGSLRCPPATPSAVVLSPMRALRTRARLPWTISSR